MTPLTFFSLLRLKLRGKLEDALRRYAAGNDYHLFARVLPLDAGRLLDLLHATLEATQPCPELGSQRLPHFDDFLFFLYSRLFCALDQQLLREPQVLDGLFADPRVLRKLAAIVARSEALPAVLQVCSKEVELLRQLSCAAAQKAAA